MQRSTVRLCLFAQVLAGLVSNPAYSATPVPFVSTSPDVSVQLGITGQDADDDDIAVDNLAGIVLLAPRGALPDASDVSGYELLGNGDQLLCFEAAVELPGSVIAGQADVVRYDGATYAIEFDASANGVPEGVGCDAVTVDASENLLLSFDVTAELPGSVFADDEDLVQVTGPSAYTLFFDGSGAGLPEAADVDGAHRLANGNLAFSLNITANVGGVDADDEDVLEYEPGPMTWSLAFDGSAQDADWAAADADAIALPEPGYARLFAAGIAGLLVIGHRRLRR